MKLADQWEDWSATFWSKMRAVTDTRMMTWGRLGFDLDTSNFTDMQWTKKPVEGVWVRVLWRFWWFREIRGGEASA